MMRVLGLVLVVCLVGGTRVGAEPPGKLTLQQRKELEARWKGLMLEGAKSYRSGQVPRAVRSFKEALRVAQRLYPTAECPRGHANLATSLNNLAMLLQARGKYAEAEPLLRDALQMRQRLFKGDYPDVANSLNNLAGLLHARGKYTEANPLFRAALQMRQRLFKGAHPDVAQSLNNLALLLGTWGKYAEAESLYRDALKMKQRLFKGDHPDVALSLSNLAVLLQARGKYAEAETLLRDALQMRQRLFKGDHPDVAQSLNNLASLLRTRGKYTEAESLSRDALKMHQRLFKGNHPSVALSLNNLAFLLQARGKYAEAETLYRDALKMRQRLFKGNHPDVACSLNNLARLLEDQGKYAEAEPLCRDALQMFQQLFKGDHPDVATSRNNLATLLRAQGKSAEAEPLCRDALKMTQRLLEGDHPDVARSLNNLAVLLHDQGKAAEAESLYRDALKMRQRLFKGAHPDVAHSLNNLAFLLQAQGKYADAEPLFHDALKMEQQLFKGNHPDVATSLNNLALLLQARGKHAEAEPLCRDALKMSRRIAVAYALGKSEGEALTLLAALPLPRDTYLSNALALQADPARIYAEVWQSKGAVARVFEQRALAARTASLKPRVATLLAQLAQSRRRRAELILAPEPADPATRKKRAAELTELAERIATLDGKLHPLLPAVPRAEKLAKATPADLQKALPADTAFLDLLAWIRIEQDPKKPGRKGWKLTRRYLAFVVTRERIVWVDLGPADPIDKAVALWREAITAPPYKVSGDLPAKVRELTWAKLRKALPPGTRVVYLSPDLGLTRLPWSALPGDKPGTLVLEEFAVAVVPHGPFLLDHLWPQDPNPRHPQGLLAVGGVAYDDQPARPDPALLAKGDRFRDGPAVKPGQKLSWGVLPSAAAEARQLAERAKRHQLPVHLLEGANASAERLLAELSKARYAHLATHGFFADASFRSVLQADPKLFEKSWRGERIGVGALSPLVMSGLVVAGANRPETPGRGLVTGESLIDRDLSGLELAVLSACETGLGDVAGGEGVFGLQRAFHLAGCRDVVASLWKVPDAATAALMGQFYKALWDDKLPPVLALQKAQLAVYRADPKQFQEMALRGIGLGDKDFDRAKILKAAPVRAGGKNPPVLWAAFTLSGPGRPPANK